MKSGMIFQRRTNWQNKRLNAYSGAVKKLMKEKAPDGQKN